MNQLLDTLESQKMIKVQPYGAESTKSFEGLSEQLMPKINPIKVPNPQPEKPKSKGKNVEVVLMQFEEPKKV